MRVRGGEDVCCSSIHTRLRIRIARLLDRYRNRQRTHPSNPPVHDRDLQQTQQGKRSHSTVQLETDSNVQCRPGDGSRQHE